MSADEIVLPKCVRRTLGWRARHRVPFDRVVRMRRDAPVYMLTHPDDVHHVLVANAENYVKTPELSSEAGRRRVGRGLLTSHGRDHHVRRRLLQPFFRRDAVHRWVEIIEARTEELFVRWDQPDERDLVAEMEGLTKSVILGVLFGADFRDEDDRVGRAIRDRRRYTDYLYHSRLPHRDRLPLPVVRRNQNALAVLDDAIRAAIERADQPGAPADAYVSLLAGARDLNGQRLDPTQIRDEALTLTSTGYETIGEALAWTLYLLLQHPEFLEPVRSEVDRTARLEEARPRVVAALQESMRLFPPTWIYSRVPLRRDTVATGTTVDAGSTLYICPYVLHRHPRYFPDPEKFDPARFSSADTVSTHGPYLPFGDGPHNCIGEHLARLEAELVLARILERYDLSLVPDQQIEPRARITLRARHGIRVRVSQRSRAAMKGAGSHA